MSGLKGVPTLQLDKIRKITAAAPATVISATEAKVKSAAAAKATSTVSSAQSQGVGALVTLLLTSQQPEVKRLAEDALNNMKFEQVGVNNFMKFEGKCETSHPTLPA